MKRRQKACIGILWVDFNERNENEYSYKNNHDLLLYIILSRNYSNEVTDTVGR